jgi:hypothetical protein
MESAVIMFPWRSAQVSLSAYCRKQHALILPRLIENALNQIRGSNASPTFLAGSTMVRSSSSGRHRTEQDLPARQQ